MNLGKMLRSGRAVDEFATAKKTDVKQAAELATTVEPVVVEKIVYVDKVVEKPVYVEKVVEKPVYVDRVVEVEKVVEVAPPVEAGSNFFDDFVPTDWAKQEVKNKS